MATHELHIDTSIPVRREASRCHNRWHPDIPPALACLPGDDILVTTRDAVDGQFSMNSTHEDVPRADRTIVHPLTGPIFVDGAEPGDLLVVEILAVQPGAFGYTAQIPGFGFLRDEFPAPFLARWEIADDWATSPDLPGVRIPGRPFMGIMGLAPSRDLLAQISVRERELAASGADVALPEPRGAVPEDAAIASEALRTKPPRENGGNLDVKDMVAGTRVLFPVWTEGALFSAGDGHFAQGDGEVCGTAIETTTTLHLRFDVVKAGAADRGIRDVMIHGNEAGALSGDYVATTGLSVYAESGGKAENLNGAARSALRNMVDYLSEEYGYTRQQAYAICSVAVDLKISEIVDAPNFVVTARLPLGIFA
ncbi:MAG: acetamidase/formamidase family protein [Solirubrobacterales bacterium]